MDKKKEIINEDTSLEPHPKDILLRNIEAGFVKARDITKKDTHKYSSKIRDAAWKSGEDLINHIAKAFFNEPPKKKYPLTSPQRLQLYALLTELVKTFQNSFKLAEEGYYRSAFGELRDILELAMMIKLFYEDVNLFGKWFKDPNKMYTTKEMRKLPFFQRSGLNEEIKGFSNVLSNNRHCSSATLDSKGSLITNVCYYRKPLFDKWCKHMIILKDLIIRIVDTQSTQIKNK